MIKPFQATEARLEEAAVFRKATNNGSSVCSLLGSNYSVLLDSQ